MDFAVNSRAAYKGILRHINSLLIKLMHARIIKHEFQNISIQ